MEGFRRTLCDGAPDLDLEVAEQAVRNIIDAELASDELAGAESYPTAVALLDLNASLE